MSALEVKQVFKVKEEEEELDLLLKHAESLYRYFLSSNYTYFDL